MATKATQPIDRVVCIDQAGDPQCVAGAGLIEMPDERFAALADLGMHLQLAITCREMMGGIPVPVKQAVGRALVTAQRELAAAHILHDLARDLAAPGKADA